MLGRPHKDRLLFDLASTREELLGEVRRIKPEDYDWAPADGMKSFHEMIGEMITMELLSVSLLAKGVEISWSATSEQVEKEAADVASAIAVLERTRAETLAYLDTCTEDTLETPIHLPESWHGYFDTPDVEPEEIVRWIVRHEYYHMGQIITYLWMKGDNPYKRND